MTQWEREKSETQQGNHLWEQTLPTQAPNFPLWSIFLCLQAFFPLKTSIRNKNWSRGFVCLSVHFFTFPLMKNKLMNEQINKNVFPWLLVEHHVASALELSSWVWISGVCKGCLGDDTILLETHTLLGQTPQKVSPIHLSFSCATGTLSQAICTLNILAGSRRHPVPRPGAQMSSYMAGIKAALQVQLSWTNELQRPLCQVPRATFAAC